MINQNYSVEQVAERLNVSVKTIRRYIYSGKISANKIGGQWRIGDNHIQDYLDSISSSKVCCDTTIDRDDFCVFMDTDYFKSTDTLQLCTIVDYYADHIDGITKLSQTLLKVVTEDGIHGGKAQFNYVYDEALKRARFVLWGNASFIKKASELLIPFEGGRDE